MRVFTFFLMVAVAVGGSLVGYRLITGRDLLSLSELGLAWSASSPAVPHSVRSSPTLAPAPSPAATIAPTPAPTASPTRVPDRPQTMLVGNTGGQGVYVRRTPRLDDRLRAWRDGTRMEIIGPVVEAEGVKWRKVRAPDGAEGYVPEQYLVEAP